MEKEMTLWEFFVRYRMICTAGKPKKRNRTMRIARQQKKNIHTVRSYDRNKVLEILRRIHEAGGCDAADEYSMGWDAAITEAIRIVEDATGLSVGDAI